MKHCPNPECAGLKKFGFASEYEDQATLCADCGAALSPGPVPEPTSPEPTPNLAVVPILTTSAEADIVIIESLLDEAGIPFLARGEQVQNLFGLGRLVGVNPAVQPVEFLVSEDDLPSARVVLADFLAQDQPAGE